MKLTSKQRTFLVAWWQHQKKHRLPPTVREAMVACGFASTNAVVCHVKALIAKGYMKRVDGREGRAFPFALTTLGQVVGKEWFAKEQGYVPPRTDSPEFEHAAEVFAPAWEGTP